MSTLLSRCIHHSGNISAAGRWCFRSLRAATVGVAAESKFLPPKTSATTACCASFLSGPA